MSDVLSSLLLCLALSRFTDFATASVDLHNTSFPNLLKFSSHLQLAS